MPTQTPVQEFSEAIAEEMPKLMSAAWAVGLEDHRANLHDHRQRVKDSHALGAKALGVELPPSADEDDNMGDIDISGDHTHTHYHGEQKTDAPPPTNQPAASGFTKAALLAAALGAGGLGVGLGSLSALWRPSQPPAPTQTTPIDSDTDTSLDVQLVP